MIRNLIHSLLQWLVGISAFVLGSQFASGSGLDKVPIHVQVDTEMSAEQEWTITLGEYPPQDPDGWFAITSGNEAGVFEMDETSGKLSLARTDVLPTLGPGPLQLQVTYYHLLEGKRVRQSSKWRFLAASGLGESEIIRKLGTATHYEFTIDVKRANLAPQFPSRPFHFHWPNPGEVIGQITANDPDADDSIRFELVSQSPPNLLRLDPQTGNLTFKTKTDHSPMPTWKGVVAVHDSQGATTKTTVWVTPPIAFPSLSIPALATSWPGKTLETVRVEAIQRLKNLPAIWQNLASAKWMSLLKAQDNGTEFSSSQVDSPQTQTPEFDLNLLARSNPAEKAPFSEKNNSSQSLPVGGPEVATDSFPVNPWMLSLISLIGGGLAYVTYRRLSRKRSAPQPAAGDTSTEEEVQNEFQPPVHSEDQPETPQETEETPYPVEEPVFETNIDNDPVSESEVDFPEDFDNWPTAEETDSWESHRPPTPSIDVPERNYVSRPVDTTDTSQPSIEKTSPTSATTEDPKVHLPTPFILEALEDRTETEVKPLEPAAPAPEELDNLLDLLGNKYGIARDEFEKPRDQEPRHQPIPRPAESPKQNPGDSEHELETSISEYMNQLLSKYSAPKESKSSIAPEPSASPEPTPVEETSAPPEKLVQPAKPAAVAPGKVPEPVCTYDMARTRSQMELLRQTSNMTASEAIRKATKRRLWKRLIRVGIAVLVVVTLCILKLVFMD